MPNHTDVSPNISWDNLLLCTAFQVQDLTILANTATTVSQLVSLTYVLACPISHDGHLPHCYQSGQCKLQIYVKPFKGCPSHEVKCILQIKTSSSVIWLQFTFPEPSHSSSWASPSNIWFVLFSLITSSFYTFIILLLIPVALTVMPFFLWPSLPSTLKSGTPSSRTQTGWSFQNTQLIYSSSGLAYNLLTARFSLYVALCLYVFSLQKRKLFEGWNYVFSHL